MKSLQANYPVLTFQKALIPEEYDAAKVYDAIATLITQLRHMQGNIASIVSFNQVKESSGASQPTPQDGEMYIWEDTGATTGQSTHYLVYNLDGTTVTFASVEVAP